MKKIRLLVGVASLACAVSFSAQAAGSAIPKIFSCWKYQYNHYILDAPCEVTAIGQPIGAPGAVATDLNGNTYFSSQSIVFKLDRNGRLSRVAGNGDGGYAGDGGPALRALLNFPHIFVYDPTSDGYELFGPLATDIAGNLYIGDSYNNRVRKVDTQGIIDTVTAHGVYGGRVVQIQEDMLWLGPQAVAVDLQGNLYVADAGGVSRVAADGTFSTLTQRQCWEHPLPNQPCAARGLATDDAGNLLVADGTCRVIRISPSGEMTVVAGNGRTCAGGDGGQAIDAGVIASAVALDRHGQMFIAGSHCVRKVDSAGFISTVAGICGSPGFSGDGGPATSAQLDEPHSVAVDLAGNLYIADTNNRRLRKVTPDGTITTVAGDGRDL